jgi:hypothetical protein
LNLTPDRGDRIGARPSRVLYFFYKSSHFMTKVEAARFLRKAEECLSQAENAVSPLDQHRWLRMAKEWLGLVKDARAKASAFAVVVFANVLSP